MGVVGVVGTVPRSDQALERYPVAGGVARMPLVEAKVLVARVAAGMCQLDAAEGRRRLVVRCTIPVSSWVVDRRCTQVVGTQAGSSRILGRNSQKLVVGRKVVHILLTGVNR